MENNEPKLLDLNAISDIHTMALEKANDLAKFCQDNNLNYMFCIKIKEEDGIPKGATAWCCGEQHSFWSLVEGMIRKVSANTLTLTRSEPDILPGDEWKLGS